MFFVTSCYDDSDLYQKYENLAGRVQKLETLCSQMNTNISSMNSIITALENNDYVTYDFMGIEHTPVTGKMDDKEDCIWLWTVRYEN